MFQVSEVEGLINLIYEAALDSSRWTNFLVALTGRLNSHTGMIWANDFTTQTIDPALSGHDIFTQVGFDPNAMVTLEQHYASRNVWMEDPRLHEGGKVVNGEMLYPNAYLKNTEFWTDWLRPLDILHTSAAIVEKTRDRSVNVTVCRPQSMGEYSADELDLFRRLMPHLQTGFALHRKLYRLNALSEAATDTLENIPYGVILLDSRGKTLFFNRLAETLANRSGALRLHDDAAVHCAIPADEGRLSSMVAGATRTGGSGHAGLTAPASGGAMRVSALDGRQLHLLVAPLPSKSTPFGMRTAAVIFVSDPEAIEISVASVLRVLYGMSPAEAQLTEALTNGDSLKEYAAARMLSPHTVRTHLKNVMAKTGMRRQTDLVRAVLTGPASLMRPKA